MDKKINSKRLMKRFLASSAVAVVMGMAMMPEVFASTGSVSTASRTVGSSVGIGATTQYALSSTVKTSSFTLSSAQGVFTPGDSVQLTLLDGGATDVNVTLTSNANGQISYTETTPNPIQVTAFDLVDKTSSYNVPTDSSWVVSYSGSPTAPTGVTATNITPSSATLS